MAYNSVSPASRNQSSVITLVITDETGNRKNEKSITVSTVAPDYPIISIYTKETSMNTYNKMKLYSLVDFASSSGNGTIVWSIDDSSINLDSVSITPVTTSIYDSLFIFSNTLRFDMAMAASTFLSSSTYTLTLSCVLISGESTSNSITVTTNSAPVMGKFFVEPVIGVEIETTFDMTTYGWLDDNLPLSYTFGIMRANTDNLSSSSFSPFISRAELSYTTTMLPSDRTSSVSNDTTVKTIVKVYNFLDAFSSLDYDVTVTRQSISMNDFTEKIDNAISNAGSDLDSLKQIIVIASSFLNEVNCTNAPTNCYEKYHRYNCSTTTNTCGACIPPYFGKLGDSNSECISSVSERRILSSVSSKSCENDCSDHGDCLYYEVSTGLQVDNCLVSNVFCEALCMCNLFYYGSSCSYKEEDYLSLSSSRSSLMSIMTTLISNEDFDSDVISSWVLMFSDIVSVRDELKTTLASASLSNMQTILTLAEEVDPLYENIMDEVLFSLDNILFILFPNNCSLNDAIQAGSTENTSYYLDTIALIVQSFSNVINSDIVFGQDDIQYVTNEIRLLSTVLSQTEANQLSLPQSELENYYGAQTPAITFPVLSTTTAISATLVVLKEKIYSEKLFMSNPLLIRMNNFVTDKSSCSSSTYGCESRIYFPTISISRAETFLNETYAKASNTFTTLCYDNDYSTHNYYCSSTKSNITVTCNGKLEYRVNDCPVIYPQSVCDIMSDTSQTLPSSCRVVSYDPLSYENITCACRLDTDISNSTILSRRLTTSNDDSSINYVYQKKYVQRSSVESYKSSTLSTEEESSIIILCTISSFIVLSMFFVSIGYYTNAKTDNFRLKNREKKEVVPETIEAVALRKGLGFEEMKDTASDKSSDNGSIAPRIDINALLNDSLPYIYHTNKSLMSKLYFEMLSHHRWFNICVFFGNDYTRLIRILSRCYDILLVFFIQAMYIFFTNPDTGSCNILDDQGSCLKYSECAWSTSTHSCFYDHSSFTAISLAQILFLSSILSVFVSHYIHLMISGLLTKTSQGNTKILPLQIANTTQRFIFRRRVKAVKNELVKDLDVFQLQRFLMDDVKRLEGNIEISNFLRAWGLDGNGLFQNHTNSTKTDVSNIVKMELEEVRERVSKEISCFEDILDTNDERRRRLVYLFQRDVICLMQSRNRHILDKLDATYDRMTTKPCSKNCKILMGSFLVSFFLGCVVFIFYCGMNLPYQLQITLIAALGVWLLLEIFFVSVIDVIISYIFIPSLISTDVKLAKDHIIKSICDRQSRRLSENDQVQDGVIHLSSARIVKPGTSIKSNSTVQMIPKNDNFTPRQSNVPNTTVVERKGLNSTETMTSFSNDQRDNIQPNQVLNSVAYFFVSKYIGEIHNSIPENDMITKFSLRLPPKMSFHENSYNPLLPLGFNKVNLQDENKKSATNTMTLAVVFEILKLPQQIRTIMLRSIIYSIMISLVLLLNTFTELYWLPIILPGSFLVLILVLLIHDHYMNKDQAISPLQLPLELSRDENVTTEIIFDDSDKDDEHSDGNISDVEESDGSIDSQGNKQGNKANSREMMRASMIVTIDGKSSNVDNRFGNRIIKKRIINGAGSMTGSETGSEKEGHGRKITKMRNHLRK